MADCRVLDAKAIKLAKQVIRMCTEAGSGHPSSALSLLHITIALMYRVMRYDPKNPWNNAADRLVLSEGHAVPVLYAAYCDLAGAAGTALKPITLKFDDCLTLRDANSVLDGHPNPALGFPFFDAATGSLGQGLSVAAGLALAARLDRLDKRIFCLIGDGESREGQIAEALDFIVDHRLTNVLPIFNCNGQGQSDYVSPQQSADVLAAKLGAYGLDVQVIDGHKWDEVFAALQASPAAQPRAIVARTVKGWGSSELSSKNYHGKPLSAPQIDQAMADLDALAAKLGAGQANDASAFACSTPQAQARTAAQTISAGSFAAALKKVGLEKPLQQRNLSTRRAYGVALAALGDADERVVALDGDVRGSTFADIFAQGHPDRYFEARIAEQNMISAAVGLAAAGKIPFASSFGKFLVRGYDQIEMAANSNANLKLCGSHVGVSLAADGPSQMGLPDVAFFRSFAHAKRPDGTPAIHVFCPSDAVSAFKLTETMANTSGLCYMRTHRPDVPFLYDENETFTLAGYKKLADGKDLTIVASGYMVHVAKQALTELARAGVAATLIDAYYLPLDTAGLLKVAQAAGNRILVVEDNYAGGFGAEVACAVAAAGKGTVRCLHVTFVPKSARTPEEILQMVHLAPADVAAAARQMLK